MLGMPSPVSVWISIRCLPCRHGETGCFIIWRWQCQRGNVDPGCWGYRWIIYRRPAPPTSYVEAIA